MLYQGALSHCHTPDGELELVSFAVCIPICLSSGHHKWMSLRCWTPGSAATSVPITGLVLVTQHGHTDAERDKQLQVMHPI